MSMRETCLLILPKLKTCISIKTPEFNQYSTRTLTEIHGGSNQFITDIIETPHQGNALESKSRQVATILQHEYRAVEVQETKNINSEKIQTITS